MHKTVVSIMRIVLSEPLGNKLYYRGMHVD